MDWLRRFDLGAAIFGLLVLSVGIYYLLVNTFNVQLPELDWDQLWPIAVIALGIGILWGTWTKTDHGTGVPHS